MEKILHHLGLKVPENRFFYHSLKNFSGTLIGAGFFPSTVWFQKRRSTVNGQKHASLIIPHRFP